MRSEFSAALSTAVWILLLWAHSAAGQEVCDPANPNGCCAYPAVARICNETETGFCYGTGTFIEHDGRPLILTCAHLFRDGVGKITVGFANGTLDIDAGLLAQDPAWDLAVLTIPRPTVTPMVIAETAPKVGDEVQSCGWGRGKWACNKGRVLGYVATRKNGTHETLEITGRAREGDSGGPMLNRQGELVAVCWGADNRTVTGTFCGRIRRFLAGIIRPLVPVDQGKQRQAEPMPARTEPPPARNELSPAKTEPPPADNVVDSLRNPLAGILDQVNRQQAAMEAEERLGRIEEALAADSSVAPAPSILTAAIPAILAGLGWTGPPALAAVAGLKVLSVLIRRRRRKRGSGEAVDAASEFPPSEPVGSIPRDDTEARQILQLSRLEGRSPLHDALIGRIAFDELDKTIDSKPDGSEADWARKLRRQLEDRFNEMAPPAVYAAAGQTP